MQIFKMVDYIILSFISTLRDVGTNNGKKIGVDKLQLDFFTFMYHNFFMIHKGNNNPFKKNRVMSLIFWPNMYFPMMHFYIPYYIKNIELNLVMIYC